MRLWTWVLTIMSAYLSLSPVGVTARVRTSTQALPSRVLWAWERPTDLRQLRPDTGVALLAQTVLVGAGGFIVEPRRQPLHVPPATPLIAVTRIETRSTAASLDAGDVARVAARVAATAALPQVVAVQIDFDATVSERDLYRRLLVAIRASLPAATPLSMTALASWCAGDRWLEALPVDEAVPMLFQMGAADEALAAIATSPTAASPACRGALGVALDEPMMLMAAGRRVYVFNGDAWTAASVDQAEGVGR